MNEEEIAALPTATHEESVRDHRHGMRFLQCTSLNGGGIIVRCFGCFEAHFIPGND